MEVGLKRHRSSTTKFKLQRRQRSDIEEWTFKRTSAIGQDDRDRVVKGETEWFKGPLR